MIIIINYKKAKKVKKGKNATGGVIGAGGIN